MTGDDPIVTGKIALAHMKEFPDYYERLERMEKTQPGTGLRETPDPEGRSKRLDLWVRGRPVR